MASTLLESENMRVAAHDGVVTCRVRSAPELSPEEGATRTAELAAFLLGEIAVEQSPYAGLILDVREAPAAYGPKTRASLEEIFSAFGERGFPLAVVLGERGVQRLQFTALCARSGGVASMVTDEESARAWIYQCAADG